MEIVLARMYEDRRRSKRHQPAWVLGLAGGKSKTKMRPELATQDSVTSLESRDSGMVVSIARGQRLPKIQHDGREMNGAQTARQSSGLEDTGGRDGMEMIGRSMQRKGATDDRKASVRAMIGEPCPRLPSVVPPGELAMESLMIDKNSQEQRQYYTLKIRPEEVMFCKEDGEDDPGLQVALSVDGMTCLSKVVKRAANNDPDKTPLMRESFIFQPEGGPVGTLLMVKLLGHRPKAEPQELGIALIDISTVPVGGHPITLVSPLTDDTGSGRVMQVTLTMKIYVRRKSFTFSYLNVEPVFRRSGYAVTAEGLQGFPMPYKKSGMPSGVSFFTLKYVHRIAEDVSGCEVWRATDRLGKSYTVKKFLIMDTACRVLFCSELDGLIDCEAGQGVELCDAFLDGVRLSIVTDDMGGVYLRDGLREKGSAAPEMVTSIILRQVLHILVSLHVDKSRLHNDIDARNILVLKTGEVRLGGFGYSLKQVGKRSKFAGPYLHMSPERLLGLECSFPSDIWSLGMLALELALGKCWYDMNKFHGIHALFEFKQIVVAEPPPSLKGATGCSNELKSFVDKCLHKNIRARDSPLQLLEHPFILRYEAFMLPAGTWLVKKVKPEVQHGMFQNHSAQTHTGDVVQSHRKMSSVSAMNEILIKSSPRLRTPGDLMSQSVSSGGQNR